MLAQSLDEIIEESEQKGEIKGELKAQHKTLIRQLQKRFGLTPKEIEKIESVSSVEKLDTALDMILTAETKEQVLEKLKG